MRPFRAPDTKKPLDARGRGKLARRSPRSLPRLRKKRGSLGAECSGGGRRCQARERLAVPSLRRRRGLAFSDMARTAVSGYPPPAPMRSSLPPKSSHVCNGSAPNSVSISSTGRIGRCPTTRRSRSSPTRPRSTAARSRSAGIPAAELVAAHGSPLVVYDEATLRADARAYRAAAPDAFVVYGTKAFPNVALLRLLAEEGIGADVSTLGELRFAQQAGIAGDRLVVHGNNKSDEELRAAAEAGALVVVDSLEEVDRARDAGVGAHADPRHAGRRGRHARAHPHRPPRLEVRPAAGRRARGAPPRARRPRASTSHVGSQLLDAGAALMAVDWLVDLRRPRPRRDRLGAAHDRPRRRARRRDRARRAAAGRSTSSCARLLARARPRLRAARPAATARDPRARPLARRARRRHALHRRLGQARVRDHDLRRRRRRHLGQPAPRALRRPLHGAAREPRRTSRRPGRTPSPASTASRATC